MNNKSESFWNNIKPWLGTAALLPLIIYYTINKGQFTFIDYINVLIHEGGHGIFKIFGKFIYTLGGTLMQIIIPSMFVIYYWLKRKKIWTQIFLSWLGENLMNISVYAADARAQRLPLLGGNKVYHDWTWLLSQTGLLEQDQIVGSIFYGTGILTFIIVLLIPLFLKEIKPANIDLNL
ncbi:MAG: hypothetical protein FIA82_05515 [Melioribacter sp.]|nr:hypothetical protein [Melioribacter sp.]